METPTLCALKGGLVVALVTGLLVPSEKALASDPPRLVNTISVTLSDGSPAGGAAFSVEPSPPESATPKDYGPLQRGRADASGTITLNIPVNPTTVAAANANGGVLNGLVTIMACSPFGPMAFQAQDSTVAFSAVYDRAANTFNLPEPLTASLTPTVVQPFMAACGGGGGYWQGCTYDWYTDAPHYRHSDEWESVGEVHTPAVANTSTAVATYAETNSASTRFQVVISPDGGKSYLGGWQEIANSTGNSGTLGWPREGYKSTDLKIGVHVVEDRQQLYEFCSLIGRPTGVWQSVYRPDRWNGPVDRGSTELSGFDTLEKMRSLCSTTVACGFRLVTPADHYTKTTGTTHQGYEGASFMGFATVSKTDYQLKTLTIDYRSATSYPDPLGFAWVWCNATRDPPNRCTGLADAPILYQAYQPSPSS